VGEKGSERRKENVRRKKKRKQLEEKTKDKMAAKDPIMSPR
jgi:hypothetical protein